MNAAEPGSTGVGTAGRMAPMPALARFLAHCHKTYAEDASGRAADYIPELSKANPAHFGISLATIDGHVYDSGDSQVEFTIQSVSKAFVFAMAMEMAGHEKVEAAIGVEPSGEAFNSIRLTADNRPFNAMVNAGAIACSGIIHKIAGAAAFDRVLDIHSRLAGRKLTVDESVFQSERATGDRNRAIGYLLRNYSVLETDVSEVLDVYFRQCSILVTSHDLAVMAATLANRGVNPVTGDRVISPYAVSRVLSVMTSSGMYDYAGEWIYRVGIPAKSGVGGGIIAALPGQFGLGTFSPLLDSHGNSVRGIKVCEDLSAQFDLHMLNRSSDVRTSIIADYDVKGIPSRRLRLPHEQAILDNNHEDIRVIEMVGALSFANADYVSRQIAARTKPLFLILDLRRVPAATEGAARLMVDTARSLVTVGATVVFSGIGKESPVWKVITSAAAEATDIRRFDLLDEAIEWAEDQMIFRYGGFTDVTATTALDQQALLAGLPPADIAALKSLATERVFHTGERLISAGEPAASFFFLLSGLVSVRLPSGVRLASLSHGMVFGEMALIEDRRSADVWADTKVTCLELPISRFDAFCQDYPRSGQRIVHNLAGLLSKRLIQANAKVDVLSAY